MGISIDPTKLTPETRWRLMRFAEVLERHPGLAKLDRADEKGFSELLDVKKTLDNCSEPEIRAVVDRINLDKVLQSVDNESPEKRTAAAEEMRRVELEVVELGKRCRDFIKNLK